MKRSQLNDRQVDRKHRFLCLQEICVVSFHIYPERRDLIGWRNVRATSNLNPTTILITCLSSFHRHQHGTALIHSMLAGVTKLNSHVQSAILEHHLDAYHKFALLLHAIWQEGGRRPRLGQSTYEQVNFITNSSQRPGYKRRRRLHGVGLPLPESGEG